VKKFDPRYYAKAVVGFVAPGVVALMAAVQDASPGGSTITTPEWVGIAAACVLTAAGVYAIPNRAAAPAPVVDPNAELGEGE
jgi:hypothetical protein